MPTPRTITETLTAYHSFKKLPNGDTLLPYDISHGVSGRVICATEEACRSGHDVNNESSDNGFVLVIDMYNTDCFYTEISELNVRTKVLYHIFGECVV